MKNEQNYLQMQDSLKSNYFQSNNLTSEIGWANDSCIDMQNAQAKQIMQRTLWTACATMVAHTSQNSGINLRDRVINSLWKKCTMRLHEWKGTHIHIQWLVMDKHKLTTANCSDNSFFVKSRVQLHQKREMEETVKVKKTLDLWSNLWS
jgi:hypothetical protein